VQIAAQAVAAKARKLASHMLEAARKISKSSAAKCASSVRRSST